MTATPSSSGRIESSSSRSSSSASRRSSSSMRSPSSRAFASLRVVQSQRVSSFSSAEERAGVAGVAAHAPSRSSPSCRCGTADAARPSARRRRSRRWGSASSCIRLRVIRAPTTSWWWKWTPPGPIDRGRGLPMSWNRAARRRTLSGLVFATTAMVWARTSLCRWIGILLEGERGQLGEELARRAPCSTTNHSPGAGSGSTISLSSSSRIRSLETISRREPLALDG